MKIPHIVFIIILGAYSLFAVIPGSFNLSTPNDLATGVALKPTLTWGAAANAASYKVQICTMNWWTTDNVVNTAGITSTSYSLPSNLTALTYYYWRVIAYGTTGDESTLKMCSPIYRTFTTTGTAPGVPTLSSPTIGATSQALKPVLTWSPVSGATDYLYQVALSTSFSPLYASGSTTSTNWTPTSNMAYNTTYYWRIASKNSYENSAYTGAWNFKTQTQVTAPAAPTLSSPANGAINQPTTITFSWSAPTGANTYQIQIAQNSTFTTIVVDNAGLSTTSYTASNLNIATTLYWRVSASNAAGTSAWSAVRSFSTANPNTGMTWPAGTAQTLSSMFGPRHMSPDLPKNDPKHGSWFHTGIDMEKTSTIVAPYNMILRNIGSYRYVFECQETGIEPKHVQFQEVELKAGTPAFEINSTTFTRGAVLPFNSTFNGYHIDAWPTGLCIVNDWTANNGTSKNPFQWLSFTQNPGVILNIYPQSDGVNPVTFPTEGTRMYFEIKINIKRPDFSLNAIKITLNDATDPSTANFLEDPVVQEINFNERIGVPNTVDASPTLLASYFITPAVWSIETNGARIYPGDLTSATTERFIAIRYYLLKQPTEVHVQTIDVNGNEINKQDFIYPNSCINCTGTGPRPPGSLCAVQTTQGVKLTWTASPDAGKVLFYSIYRRPANSTVLPKSIAVISKSFMFYEDRIDAPGNTLTGGQTYKYSIACIGNSEEGCNGPVKPGCTGPRCPLSCVNEQSATVPSLPNYILYEGRRVYGTVADVKAKNAISMRQDEIYSSGSVNFTAGQTITISGGVTAASGAKTTIKIDPAVK